MNPEGCTSSPEKEDASSEIASLPLPPLSFPPRTPNRFSIRETRSVPPFAAFLPSPSSANRWGEVLCHLFRLTTALTANRVPTLPFSSPSNAALPADATESTEWNEADPTPCAFFSHSHATEEGVERNRHVRNGDARHEKPLPRTTDSFSSCGFSHNGCGLGGIVPFLASFYHVHYNSVIDGSEEEEGSPFSLVTCPSAAVGLPQAEGGAETCWRPEEERSLRDVRRCGEKKPRQERESGTRVYPTSPTPALASFFSVKIPVGRVPVMSSFLVRDRNTLGREDHTSAHWICLTTSHNPTLSVFHSTLSRRVTVDTFLCTSPSSTMPPIGTSEEEEEEEEGRFQLSAPISAEKINEWLGSAGNPMLSPRTTIPWGSSPSFLSSSMTGGEFENRAIVSLLFPAFHYHQRFESLSDFELHCRSVEHTTCCSTLPLVPLHRCSMDEKQLFPSINAVESNAFLNGHSAGDGDAYGHHGSRHEAGKERERISEMHSANACPGVDILQEDGGDGVASLSTTPSLFSPKLAGCFLTSGRACLMLDLFSRLKEQLNPFFSFGPPASRSPLPEEESAQTDETYSFSAFKKETIHQSVWWEGPHNREDEESAALDLQTAFQNENWNATEKELEEWRKVVPHTLAARVAVLVTDALIKASPSFLSVDEPRGPSLSPEGCGETEEGSESAGGNGEGDDYFSFPPFPRAPFLLRCSPDAVFVKVPGGQDGSSSGAFSASSVYCASSAACAPSFFSSLRMGDTAVPPSDDVVGTAVCWSSWPSVTRWLWSHFLPIWNAVLHEMMYRMCGLRIHPVISVFLRPPVEHDVGAPPKVHSLFTEALQEDLQLPKIPPEEVSFWKDSAVLREIVALLSRVVVIFAREKEMRERLTLLRSSVRLPPSIVEEKKREQEELEVEVMNTKKKIFSSSHLPVESTDSSMVTNGNRIHANAKILSQEGLCEDEHDHRKEKMHCQKRRRDRIDEVNSDFYYLMAELIMTTSLDLPRKKRARRES